MANRIILEYIQKKNTQITCNDKTDLIKHGFVDSLGMIELILYIENNYKIRINQTDLNIEHFRNVSSIERLVEKYVG